MSRKAWQTTCHMQDIVKNWTQSRTAVENPGSLWLVYLWQLFHQCLKRKRRSGSMFMFVNYHIFLITFILHNKSLKHTPLFNQFKLSYKVVQGHLVSPLNRSGSGSWLRKPWAKLIQKQLPRSSMLFPIN